MPTTCCVMNCGSRADRDFVQFFKIPSELHFAHRVDLNELSKKRRQQWIQALRRKGLTDARLKYYRVCSNHFLSGKPSALIEESSLDWVPSVAMGFENDAVVCKKPQIGTTRKDRAHDHRSYTNTHDRASKRRKCLVDDISQEIFDVPNEVEVLTVLKDERNENDKQCQTDITSEDFTQIMIFLESIKKNGGKD